MAEAIIATQDEHAREQIDSMSSTYVIPNSSKYWASVLRDIPKKLLNCPVLYMVRIYLEVHDKYMYKLGFTEDFHGRLIRLNYEYGACGRIIPVIVARCAQQKKERSAHKKLNTLCCPTKTGFVLHRELYKISPENYDTIKDAIVSDMVTDNNNTFWESETYCIDEKRDEEDIAESNMDLSFFELFDDTYLCQDDSEADFWEQHIYG